MKSRVHFIGGCSNLSKPDSASALGKNVMTLSSGLKFRSRLDIKKDFAGFHKEPYGNVSASDLSLLSCSHAEN